MEIKNKMKDEEFRKWYKAMVEWEPLPVEQAKQLLKRIMAILFEQPPPRLEDKGEDKDDS